MNFTPSVNMTVVNGQLMELHPEWLQQLTQAQQAGTKPAHTEASAQMLLAHVVRQTNAALLYADEVTLVSPSAAFMQSLERLGGLDDGTLFRALQALTTYRSFFPQLMDAQEIFDYLWAQTNSGRAGWFDIDAAGVALLHKFPRIRDDLQEIASGMLANSQFDQLRLAVDAGLLTIDRVPGSEVDNYGPTLYVQSRAMAALEAGGGYPLFDVGTAQYVQTMIDHGVLAPVPLAERQHADASLARGLFDCLPTFENATTSEIIDIRHGELGRYLGAFRQGISDLTSAQMNASPRDPQYAEEIAYLWTTKVGPELDNIQNAIQSNSSLSELVRKTIKPVAAETGLALAGGELVVAAGAPGMTLAAISYVLSYGVTMAKALMDQQHEIQEEKKAQLYYLYGLRQALTAF